MHNYNLTPYAYASLILTFSILWREGQKGRGKEVTILFDADVSPYTSNSFEEGH
jgi:hypothetical protein